MSGEKQTKRKSTKKNKQRNKIILIVVELIVLVVLAVALYGISKLNKIQRDDSFTPEDVEVNEDIQSETIEVMDNFKTIAVFGLDASASGNLASGRSDVIMVVTINNDTQEVKMCSVYRDTYLDVGSGKFRKANSAFSSGGAQAAISMLNRNLDLNITDYVTVDFGAVVECIDLIGGVEMTITDEEAILMTGYMEEINKMTGNNSKVPESGGTYNLDGVQATAYARIRYTAGDDYKRTERQRDVIIAMAKKAQQSDLATINKVIDQVFGDIGTSFSNSDLISLAAQVFEYEITGSAGFPFSKNTITLGSKGSIVAPCTLETNVIQLHEFLYNNTDYEPSSTVKANSMKIESDTGYGPNDGY